MQNVELRNLRIIAVLTWAIVGIPAIVWEIDRGTLDSLRALTWIAVYIAFIVLFWTGTRGQCTFVSRLTSIALQTCCWIVCLLLNQSGFLAVLMVIVAAEIGRESLRLAFGWIIMQSLVLVPLLMPRIPNPISFATAYFGFQLFALYAARVAYSEAEARQKLAEAHAQLQVTTGLLEINSRSEERLRIARELHDILGHHLTALSLNLEVATHLSSGEARVHVEKSHALTRVLLTDVREAVSQLREHEPVDLARAARALAGVVSAPRLHVEAPESINVADAVGRTALRALQEIVTNAMRHSSARNLWISVEQRDHELLIVGRDDGKGSDVVRFGNGLTGMRERISEAGGRFSVESRRGEGFVVNIALPVGGSA